jgi:hypothetical protein
MDGTSVAPARIDAVEHPQLNQDNALSGDVDIAAGVLTDRNVQMQGNGATAHIATRTDLANATTDTTINFMLAEDPSAPYLIATARGPLASPTFNATRGSAKDPPGTISTLLDNVPSMPRVPLPKISIPTPAFQAFSAADAFRAVSPAFNRCQCQADGG